MKRRLMIAGAGGFGREVLQWAEDAIADGAPWVIGGFLDANPDALTGFDIPVSVLGHPSTYRPQPDDVGICAIGDPVIRMRVVAELERQGMPFTTLIHPTAIVGARCRIGEGCILCPRVTLTTDVTLGRHVLLNLHTSVGHDAVIGDGCSVFAHCDVTGFTKLGNGVTLGSHSSILPGMQVGDGAKISAGSVVARRVKPYTTVYGVPARKLVTAAPPKADVKAA